MHALGFTTAQKTLWKIRTGPPGPQAVAGRGPAFSKTENIGRSAIFNLKKDILKKTKFWRRNRSFTFTPEVKVYPFSD